MSELEDVQTTVAVIDGLRSRIAELELVTRHSTRTLDLPGSPAPKAADLLPGVEHYDGCWQYHFDCAIERIAELEAEKQALITTSVVVNEELSEAKQAIEWLTEQHEDAYKKVGYQAQRAEQAEAILLGEDVTVAAYRNMQAALAQREAERDKVVSVLARALAAKLDQQNRAEQAEAEVAELKVCIVCDHCSGVDDSRWCDEEKPWDESVWLYDLCHYSPSRWTARAERGAK